MEQNIPPIKEEKTPQKEEQDKNKTFLGMELKDLIDSIVKLSGIITILIAVLSFMHTADKDRTEAELNKRRFEETIESEKRNFTYQKTKDLIAHLRDLKSDSTSAANIRNADSLSALNTRMADSVSFKKMEMQFYESTKEISLEKQATLNKEQSSNYIDLCIKTINQSAIILLDKVSTEEYKSAVLTLNGNLLSQHKLFSNNNITIQLGRFDSIMNEYNRRRIVIEAFDSIVNCAYNLRSFLAREQTTVYSADLFEKGSDIKLILSKFIDKKRDSITHYYNTLNSVYGKIDEAIDYDYLPTDLIRRHVTVIIKQLKLIGEKFVNQKNNPYFDKKTVETTSWGQKNYPSQEIFFHDYITLVFQNQMSDQLNGLSDLKDIYFKGLKNQNANLFKRLQLETDKLISLLSAATKEKLNHIYIPEKN